MDRWRMAGVENSSEGVFIVLKQNLVREPEQNQFCLVVNDLKEGQG